MDSAPAPTIAYDPSRSFTDVLSLMSGEAGQQLHYWQLLETLADQHGLGDVSAPIAPFQLNSTRDKTIGVLEALSRLKVNDETRPRQLDMIKRVMAAGANPWASGVGGGVCLLVASASSSCMNDIVRHPDFPGWSKLATVHEFFHFLAGVDRAGLEELLAAGMPLDLVGKSAYATSGRQDLMAMCKHPSARDELIRRGAQLGPAVIKDIQERSDQLTPAIMERAIQGQVSPDHREVALAVFIHGLRNRRPGAIKVGAALAGPDCIEKISTTSHKQTLVDAIAAIASAAHRGVFDLSDHDLVKLVAQINKLYLDPQLMRSFTSKKSMAWLGARIEDLGHRLAEADPVLPEFSKKSIHELAVILSGIREVPWRLTWRKELDWTDRADLLLSRCKGSALDAISTTSTAGEPWMSALHDTGFKRLPSTFLRPLGDFATSPNAAVLALNFASRYVAAGGDIKENDFIQSIEKQVDRFSTNGVLWAEQIQDMRSKLKLIHANHAQWSMEQATTQPTAPSRPKPRM